MQPMKSMLGFSRVAGRMPSALRRANSTLRLLQPQAVQAAAGPQPRLPTVYVTGFLTQTSSHENYNEWLSAHNQLHADTRLDTWCKGAYGLEWRTGSSGDWLGRFPLPLHIAVMLMRRSSPAALAAGVAGDALLNATRLFLTFREAERTAERDAPDVARSLADLKSANNLSGYRVVAHSLGCRLMIDSLPLLPAASRPSELHLCAAAVTPSHAVPRLHECVAPGGRIYHYFSDSDEALMSGFLLASRGESALGSLALPPDAPSNASSHDATAYLGVASHGEYRKEFHRLAADALLGHSPPPRQSWLVRQRAMAAEQLTRALRRLPSVPSMSASSVTTSAGLVRSWLLRRGGMRRH